MPITDQLPLYLVDDDRAVLDSLGFMLESCDIAVRGFDDGERFLAEVALHQPACLILDCRMPGLSGPELQQRLKEAQSPIAILFLTGHGGILETGGGRLPAKTGAARPPAKCHQAGLAGHPSGGDTP